MYKFGTIVLIPFPFTDLTSTKVRPALIISKTSPKANDLVVAFISSKTREQEGFLLKTTDKHFKLTGLKVDSLVRFDKLATLSKTLILGELGALHPDLIKRAKPSFAQVFGF